MAWVRAQRPARTAAWARARRTGLCRTPAWASAGAGAVAAAGPLRVGRRAGEPVLPLGLFKIRTFTLCSVISFVVGFAMFGAM
ncbi:hypothetical protein OV450_1571, partial [Actinobacteria bacterium OV450]